jgi:hypothetical protein
LHCCCSCCLHHAPLQCNGHMGCCAPFSRLCPYSKGATAAAVSRCCCLHCCGCCLHPSPLQCNGRTGCCPAFSRLCPYSTGATAAAVSRCCCLHCGLHCCLHPSVRLGFRV